MSGEIPKHPVISKKTGHLFEKSAVLAYLKAHSTCPITGASMSEDDVVEVQCSKFVKPRPVNANSIPSLLQSFQAILYFQKKYLTFSRMNGRS